MSFMSNFVCSIVVSLGSLVVKISSRLPVSVMDILEASKTSWHTCLPSSLLKDMVQALPDLSQVKLNPSLRSPAIISARVSTVA